MRQIIQTILLKIASSVNGNTPVSSVRVQSYIMMLPILLMVAVFVIIELAAFIHSVRKDNEYHISNEIIVIFAMNLSHHLAILFSRSKSQGLAELSGTATSGTATSETTTTETTNTNTEVVTKEKTKEPVILSKEPVKEEPKDDIPNEDPEKS